MSSSKYAQPRSSLAQHVAAAALWPAIVLLPLALHARYERVFPQRWYEPSADHKPLGLSLGILAVTVGQAWVLLYQAARYHGREIFGPLERVQPNEERPYALGEGVATHLAQPEGFVLLWLYLAVTWLMGWMPPSYYSFEGGICWPRVLACLLVQDAIQCCMHLGEHKIHAAIYRASHKPHHRFTNPRLFDAFNGSVADTVLMILIPLYTTANVVSGCNVWDYMCFGSLYANWLVLIHSEFHHAWDPAFAAIGFGTAADHHVHHKLFVKNFGCRPPRVTPRHATCYRFFRPAQPPLRVLGSTLRHIQGPPHRQGLPQGGVIGMIFGVGPRPATQTDRARGRLVVGAARPHEAAAPRLPSLVRHRATLRDANPEPGRKSRLN